MNEDQKIIELKKKINNEDFRMQEKEIKNQHRMQKLIKSAPKKKKRKFNILNFAFMVFIFYFGYTAFNQYQMINELNKEIDEKNHSKAKVEKEVQDLKKDVEKINDEEALLELVEKIAREQYKMVKPNETIYIDKNKNDNKLIQGIGLEEELEN
ncbi:MULTISPECIES: FtsB family cell division protein [unclassified Sedimentibacter]|uniref:FtsB family cell division protein n=1 Tax=unclassified Sedimentibacter TaxID=2649220 RepID=UPI0027DF711C|nr:septum formation initiator family protein [Sedimentibacter sp. MB35-C1]WMJ76756.1 septum formation initiator family protein [Sedimentibacter sp. MB35-C1]